MCIKFNRLNRDCKFGKDCTTFVATTPPSDKLLVGAIVIPQDRANESAVLELPSFEEFKLDFSDALVNEFFSYHILLLPTSLIAATQ